MHCRYVWLSFLQVNWGQTKIVLSCLSAQDGRNLYLEVGAYFSAQVVGRTASRRPAVPPISRFLTCIMPPNIVQTPQLIATASFNRSTWWRTILSMATLGTRRCYTPIGKSQYHVRDTTPEPKAVDVRTILESKTHDICSYHALNQFVPIIFEGSLSFQVSQRPLQLDLPRTR